MKRNTTPLILLALSITGVRCGNELEGQYSYPTNKFEDDTIMLNCTLGSATYLASQSTNSYDIGSKNNGHDKGLSIGFYSYENSFSVSYISNKTAAIPFTLTMEPSSESCDGGLHPNMYFYNDYAYFTDTIIDVRSDLILWYSAIGKCFIVKYWPNSMCRSHGFFLYNENYEINGGTKIGIHRSYDELGNLTDIVDADTLIFYERIE